MFKLVKGTLDELEAKLNAAITEGYTQLFREFPSEGYLSSIAGLNPLSAPHVEPTAPTYAFMMQKPPAPVDFGAQIKEHGATIRQVLVMLGMGDRLPPEPKNASVHELELVSRPKEKEEPC